MTYAKPQKYIENRIKGFVRCRPAVDQARQIPCMSIPAYVVEKKNPKYVLL